MVAKWVIVAFAGISALFAAESRAVPVVPEKLKGAITDLNSSLGASVLVESYVFEEKPRSIEKMIGYLGSKAFGAAFFEIQTKCGWGIKKIRIGETYGAAHSTLSINATDKHAALRLERMGAVCERVERALARIRAVLGPSRSVEVETTFLLTGEITAAQLEAWSYVISKSKFPDLLDSYGDACRRPVNVLRFGITHGYYDGRKAKAYQINAGSEPDGHLRGLARTVKACGDILPVLHTFNSAYAIDHGVVLSVDVERLAQRDVSVKGIKRWLDYFSKDPTRLDRLKKVILDSRPGDYEEIRKCDGISSEDCRRRLVGVSFNTYTGFNNFQWSAGIFLMLGDFLTVGMLTVDAAINGPIVNLGSAENPRVPKRLN